MVLELEFSFLLLELCSTTPTEITPDILPPAPANFIEPYKRALSSSTTPFIVAKVWQEELLSSFLFKPSKTPSTWTVKMQEIL
jgi:hypothetical protein